MEKVKWNLWHGKSEIALECLTSLIKIVSRKKSLSKLQKLYTYIGNNRNNIVNYEERKTFHSPVI